MACLHALVPLPLSSWPRAPHRAMRDDGCTVVLLVEHLSGTTREETRFLPSIWGPLKPLTPLTPAQLLYLPPSTYHSLTDRLLSVSRPPKRRLTGWSRCLTVNSRKLLSFFLACESLNSGDKLKVNWLSHLHRHRHLAPAPGRNSCR